MPIYFCRLKPDKIMDFLNQILASSDDVDGKFWLWLIIGIGYLIKKVIEAMKGDSETDESAGDTVIFEKEEAPDVPRKTMREILEEMHRENSTPSVPPQQPSYAPPHAPIEEQVKKSLAPAKMTKPKQEWQSPELAASYTLDHYKKATEQAKNSINALSDVERVALSRLHQHSQKPNLAPQISHYQPMGLKSALHSKKALRDAILYQEILSKPRALRDGI